MNEQEIRQLIDTMITERISSLIKSDRLTIEKLMQVMDGRNIQLGRTTGTKIGTATDQLLAFWGGTPVDRPATVNDPAGGVTIDTEARAAISSLIDRLQEINLIA